MGFEVSPKALITFAVAIAFLVAVVPSALSDIFAVNTSGWSTSAASLWPLIGLALIGTIILVFVPKGGGKGAS